MGDYEDEQAIKRWLITGASSTRAGSSKGRRQRTRQTEQVRRSKQALEEAEFMLTANEMQMLIRENDPYGSPRSWRDMAWDWEALGLTSAEGARWIKAGASLSNPSLVMQFKMAKVPVEIAFSPVFRKGHPTGETYYELAMSGYMHPKKIYNLAVQKGVITESEAS